VGGGSTLESVIRYAYSGGKLSHIRVSGGSDSTAYVLSHDVNYSGNDMVSLTIDSSVGEPKGIPASFIDFVWSGGNIISFGILLGTDTIEISVTYDDKNNVFKHLVNKEGAIHVIMAASANNILKFTLVNDENIPGIGSFPAGTVIMDNTFTDTNADGNVETRAEAQSLFAENPKTTQFIYDCSSGILSPAPATSIGVYPNPATEFIRLDNESFRGTVRIFDAAGKVVINRVLNDGVSSLDVRTLTPGVYYVEMTDNDKVFKGNFLKE
jgi:hypothetical protein